MQIIEGAGRWLPSGDWVEHVRVPDLSVGTYCIPAGGTDNQSPHTEDEVYVVTAGRARIVTPGGTAEVGPGSVIFVPAGEEHRFTDVTEDLALLVVFGPAYGARSNGRDLVQCRLPIRSADVDERETTWPPARNTEPTHRSGVSWRCARSRSRPSTSIGPSCS